MRHSTIQDSYVVGAMLAFASLICWPGLLGPAETSSDVLFDVALEDDGTSSTVLLWNSITGAYRFCCNGITFTGVSKATRQGCVYTLNTNAIDRRVVGRVDKAVHAASIQAPAGTIRCTITDRNTLNDANVTSCQ